MSAVQRAGILVHRVSSLRDVDLRVAYVSHELRQLDAAVIADVWAVVSARAEGRDESYGSLMLAMALALSSPDLMPLRRAVARAAASRGFEQVALQLMLPSESEDDGQAATHVPDLGQGRPLTLGERKALARTHDRMRIARVLRDPHPSVIEILLGNPCLTEDDVIRLASRRNVDRDVLRMLFRATRWIVRYRVRRTLAKNTSCPLDIALQLAPLLTVADAREIACSPEYPDALRIACRRGAGGQHPIH